MPDPLYYNKPVGSSTDVTLVLEGRQGLLMPFDVISNWTSLRIGMFASWTSSAVLNASAFTSTETMPNSNWNNKAAFGIKTNDANLPGTVGTNFAGWLTYNGTLAQITGATRAVVASSATVYASYSTVIDTTENNFNSTTGNHFSLPTPAASSSDTNYATFIGLQFNLNDVGLATQNMDIGQLAASDVSDTSSANLLATMANAVNSARATGKAWNDGAAALDRPTCLFVRWPFYNHRLRIHSIGVIAYE